MTPRQRQIAHALGARQRQARGFTAWQHFIHPLDRALDQPNAPAYIEAWLAGQTKKATLLGDPVYQRPVPGWILLHCRYRRNDDDGGCSLTRHAAAKRTRDHTPPLDALRDHDEVVAIAHDLHRATDRPPHNLAGHHGLWLATPEAWRDIARGFPRWTGDPQTTNPAA